MRVGEKLLSTSGVEVDGSFSFMVFDFRVQRVKIIPVIINLSPSGNAVTILIKIIPFIINLFPLPRRPDSIILLIPPAVFFLLPGACQNSVRYLYIYHCKAQNYSGKIFVFSFFQLSTPLFIRYCSLRSQ